MCGFVGMFLNDSSSLEEDRYRNILKKMSEVIEHRGPDNHDIFLHNKNNLGLAFQRLSIIDLNKNANQPMISRDKDWIIVYNGEVYNFNKLRKDVCSDKSFWRTSSDTEVVLEHIAKYGFLNSIPKFNGMFAIAAYCFSKKTLWLARDKYGEKPLYYNYTNKEGIIFSSDIRSLFLYPYIRKQISIESFSQYMRYGFVPEPLCILKNTYKIEPGSIIKYNKENLIKKLKYWDSFEKYTESNSNKFKGSFNDAKNQFKSLIDSSVKDRLTSDVPLGIFLSGGVDSSNLVLSLKRQKVDTKTFSIGFNDKKTNETFYANKIAQKLNTKHYEKFINDKDCLNEITNIVKAYDEPFSDPSQIPTFLLCKFAKKNVTVALSGDGADELFCGYPRYYDTLKFWSKIENNPKLISQIYKTLAMKLSSSENKILRSMGKKLRKRSHRSLESIYRDQMSRWRPDECIYDYNILNNSNYDKASSYNNKISKLRFLMLTDIMTYLPSNLLVKIDRASMANSLEVRSPYLDADIVNFTWSLPDDYIFRNNEKILLKSILAEKFSDDIVHRKKQGFEPPLYKWLQGPLKGWTEDLIYSQDNYLNKKTCIKILNRLQSGEKKLTYKLWTIIMFKAWKNLYFS